MKFTIVLAVLAVVIAAMLSPLRCAHAEVPAVNSQSQDTPDLILFNAQVVTVDKDFAIKQAVQVKDIQVLQTYVGGKLVHEAR